MNLGNSRLIGACCCYKEGRRDWRALGRLSLCLHFLPQILLWTHAYGRQVEESPKNCLRRAASPHSLPASAAREFETHIKGNKREIIEVELEKSPKEVIVPYGSQFFPSVNCHCLSVCISSFLPWSEKDEVLHPDTRKLLLLCISRPQSFQVCYIDGCKQLLRNWGIKSINRCPWKPKAKPGKEPRCSEAPVHVAACTVSPRRSWEPFTFCLKVMTEVPAWGNCHGTALKKAKIPA